MANMRILARNLAENASITASPALTDLSAVPGLPETSLLLPTQRGRVARTSGLASQDYNVSLDAVGKVNMIALTRTNHSTGATMQGFLYNAIGSPSLLLLDTGAAAGFSTAGLDTDIDVYTEDYFANLRNSRRYFTEQSGVQYVVVRVLDAANADGYVEQTKLFIGQYFELATGHGAGALDMTQMDASVQGRADDGTQHVDKRWKARRISINLDFVEDDDLASLLGIAHYLGKDKECFISVYPEEGGAKELYHQGAFRLVEAPSFTPIQYRVHRNTLVFEET